MKTRERTRAACRRSVGLAFLAAVTLHTLPALSAPRDGAPLPWIFVGESLTAGVQNGALLDRGEAMANGLGNLGQQNGYAGQLAVQGGAPLTFPRILWPGFPNVITAVNLSPFAIERVLNPPFTPGRLNPLEQATNLGVPGDTAADALGDRPVDTCAPPDVAANPLSLSNTNCVLGAPGLLPDDPALQVARSQVEWAEALTAGTVFVLLGTNESLGAIFEANPLFLTPVDQFEVHYAEVVARLAAVSTTLVAATVPDQTLIPFLTSSGEVAELLGLDLAAVRALLGLEPGDFVTPLAFPQIEAIIADPLGPPFGPLTPDVVLTAGEADTVRTAIDGYNDVIERTAAAHGAVLVDFHARADELAATGIVVGGQRLTFDFGGGVFSLDGVHLSNTGYAILANAYIHALNTQRGAGIPPIPLPLVKRQDPLVGMFVGRPPTALGVITPDMVQSLERRLLSE